MHTEADLDRQLQEAIMRGRGTKHGGIIIGRRGVTAQETARKIMGPNFFGIEEAVKYFGVTPEESERQSVIPCPEEALRRLKDTHILTAIFPLSILDVRGHVDRTLFFSHENAWCNNEAFTKEKGEAMWALVRKTSVPNSISKTWSEQQALLSKEEETPAARIMVYTIIGHYLATGERLFENIYVRCSDLAAVGYRVIVGRFDSGGLRVDGVWVGVRNIYFGVSAARKLE